MGVPQVIMAPVGEHSAKPGEVHRRIERVLAMPYLELFARAKRPGWVTWGNEVPFAADRHCRLVFAEVCYRCGALATLATLEVWE